MISDMQKSTGYWIIFDQAGYPAWFGTSWVRGAEWVEGVSAETLMTCRRVDGEWVTRTPEPVVDPEPIKPDEEALEEARKIKGVAFEGVMCSATKEDQDGLAAVLLAIQLQGAEFKPTVFHFANGSRLVISLANYEALAATWLPFRQSFFRA